MPYDLVIHNGTVVTVDADSRILENGMVCITDGVIRKIGPSPRNEEPPESRQTIDAKNGIVMPGLVNTHTHAPMALFRGLADDLPLEIWLNDHIFPTEAKHVTPENVRIGTALACAEMLLGGTTTCCDGYFLEDAVANTVVETKMRAILGQGVIDFPAPGVPDPAQNVRSAAGFLEKWRHISGLISPSVFCHSPYTCSAETLKAAKAAAEAQNALFQIHLAETRYERRQVEKNNGASPVAYLYRLGILNERTLLVHAVWLDDEDIRIVADTGASVSHTPESNMKLASGIARVSEMIDAGITVGLGTDGCASNNDQDMFGEMDTAAKLHKVHRLEPTAMKAAQVLRSATVDAARAIGLGPVIGSLEVGKAADLIVIDTGAPHCVPLYHPTSHLVYSANRDDVRHVVVGGEILVKDKRLIYMDLEEILDRAEAVGRKITGTRKDRS